MIGSNGTTESHDHIVNSSTNLCFWTVAQPRPIFLCSWSACASSDRNFPISISNGQRQIKHTVFIFPFLFFVNNDYFSTIFLKKKRCKIFKVYAIVVAVSISFGCKHTVEPAYLRLCFIQTRPACVRVCVRLVWFLFPFLTDGTLTIYHTQIICINSRKVYCLSLFFCYMDDSAFLHHCHCHWSLLLVFYFMFKGADVIENWVIRYMYEHGIAVAVRFRTYI